MFGMTPNGLVPRRVSQSYAEPGVHLKNAGPGAEKGVHQIVRPSRVNPAKCDRRVRSPEDIQKHWCAAVAPCASVVREHLITSMTTVRESRRDLYVAYVTLGPAARLADHVYELTNTDVGFRSHNDPDLIIDIDRQH